MPTRAIAVARDRPAAEWRRISYPRLLTDGFQVAADDGRYPAQSSRNQKTSVSVCDDSRTTIRLAGKRRVA